MIPMETEGPLSWRWNKVPISKGGRARSQIFRFREAKWSISLSGGYCDVLHLDLDRDTQFVYSVDAPFSVSVLVEDGSDTGRVLPDLCDRRDGVRWRGGCIWWRWDDDIERAYPEYQSRHELTFRITIEEMNTQTGITILSDASAQTEDTSLCTVNSITNNYNETNSSTTDSNTADSTATNSKTQTPLSTSTLPCLVSLSEDLAKLLDEESYPDVEFHCGDFSTKAHRAVVSTRSPVLARMLKSDMVEGKTGMVEIKDMDADTFKQMFRYLYTGKLNELTFDVAMPLYEAADQYAVHGLACRCSEFISKNLSEDNAYDVLIVADAHSDLKFVEVIVEYMVKHKLPLSSNSWPKFSDDQPRLANKVLNRFCHIWARNVPVTEP